MVKNKFALDFIKELSEPIELLNRNKVELEVEQERLLKELNKIKDDFSLETIQNSKNLELDLDHINKAVANLGKKSAKVKNRGGEQQRRKMNQAAKSIKESHDVAKNKSAETIKKHIESIKSEMMKLKEIDNEITAELQAFKSEIAPYLSEEPLASLGGGKLIDAPDLYFNGYYNQNTGTSQLDLDFNDMELQTLKPIATQLQRER